MRWFGDLAIEICSSGGGDYLGKVDLGFDTSGRFLVISLNVGTIWSNIFVLIGLSFVNSRRNVVDGRGSLIPIWGCIFVSGKTGILITGERSISVIILCIIIRV